MAVSEIINLVAAVAFSGPVASVVTQIVKRNHWSGAGKLLVAIGLSGAAGLAQAWLSGDVMHVLGRPAQLTAGDISALIGAVFVGATAFYKLYFAHTKWGARLGRL